MQKPDIITDHDTLSARFDRLQGLLPRAESAGIEAFNIEASQLINSIRTAEIPQTTVSFTFKFDQKTFPYWYTKKPVDDIEQLSFYHLQNDRLIYQRRAVFGERNGMLSLVGVTLMPAKDERLVAYIFSEDERTKPNVVVSPATETPRLYLSTLFTGGRI